MTLHSDAQGSDGACRRGWKGRRVDLLGEADVEEGESRQDGGEPMKAVDGGNIEEEREPFETSSFATAATTISSTLPPPPVSLVSARMAKALTVGI